MHSISINLTEDTPLLRTVKCERGPLLWENWRAVMGLSRSDVAALSQKQKVVYIFTDYFGGAGRQYADIWEKGQRRHFDRINDALQQIGVKAAAGQDEFDTIGLGGYRDDEALRKAAKLEKPAERQARLKAHPLDF